MRQRCNNPNNDRYQDYGGRGIRYAAHWDSFDNFLADMGERPSLEVSLDRIDNDKGYSPENCRWADRATQSMNQKDLRRSNTSGTKGVYCEKGVRWRAEGIYRGVKTCLYQGKSEWEAKLARWEWEFVVAYHNLTGEWI
jgi:hypothetical protein